MNEQFILNKILVIKDNRGAWQRYILKTICTRPVEDSLSHSELWFRIWCRNLDINMLRWLEHVERINKKKLLGEYMTQKSWWWKKMVEYVGKVREIHGMIKWIKYFIGCRVILKVRIKYEYNICTNAKECMPTQSFMAVFSAYPYAETAKWLIS